MARFKKIFLDLDGTVLDFDGVMHTVVSQKIADASKSISISFCSGRFTDFVVNLCKEHNVYGNHIVEGGSKVITSKGSVLWKKIVPKEVVLKVIELGKQYHFHVAASVNGKTVKYLSDAEANITQVFPWELNKDQVQLLRDNIQIPNITSQVVWFDPKKGYNISVTHKDGTKRNGVNFLLGYEHIIPEEVAAVGDGANDVELLQISGYKIAMGNAVPEVKAIADFIVAPVDNDGVIEAIDKVLSVD